MKFYLIDDDANVCNILKIIIQQKKLGEVCGMAGNGMDALEDLKFIQPDIVIVDLLMPVMDGIHFVRKAKELYPDITYVMLSQVSSKEMVAQAYECGVTFFLQKPVNGVEVVRVLGNVADSIQMKRTFQQMQSLFMKGSPAEGEGVVLPQLNLPSEQQEEKPHIKRVRAVLTLAACQLAGADAADALDYACALEMLHCYSLIHDDMPCMDNDDFRRGRPSCHKQFGEATAMLAADALVTAAFEVLAHAKCSAESRIEAVQLLAKGGGDRGMLYGQELDKHFETVRAGEAELLNLHAHKTGALIIAAVELGCAAAGVRPDTDTRKALVRYAAELGLVFQIVDDILDVTSTTEELGKPVGSDADNDKTTFITLYGLQGAHEEAERHNAAALAALDALGPGADFLRLMAAELLERKK